MLLFLIFISHFLVAQDTVPHSVPELEAHTLSEVKVTALGIRSQERAIGYSVSTVQGKDLYQDAIDPISALQGKVAGLTISGTDGGIFGRQKILLRGASTLGKSNQPLIIVDGIVLNTHPQEGSTWWYWSNNDYGDELNTINTADIDNISVLKGAASTALYGSRGMNGALVITTKSGNYRQGFGVSISQSMGFDWVFATPKLQNTYGPGSIAGAIDYGERNASGGFNSWDTQQFYLNGNGQPTLIGADGFGYGPRYDGRDIIYYDGTVGKYTPQKNAYRDFYHLGFNSNTNAIVRGGTERTSLYASLGYRYGHGTLPSTEFSRGSLLLKGTHAVNNRMHIEAQVALSEAKPQNPQLSVGDFFISQQVNPLYDSRYYRSKYKGSGGGIASSDYGDAYADVPMKSFWWRMYENSYEERNLSVRPSLAVDYHITDWLDFRAEGTMDYYHSRREVKELGQGYANEGTNDTSGGSYQLQQSTNREENLSAMLTTQKDIGAFSLGGFLRSEYRNSNSDNIYNATAGGLIAPGQYFIGNSRNTPIADLTTLARKRVWSAVAAVHASWKEQIYLEVTGRNDWSSSLVYSNGAGNYSYFYPSVSASWIVTEAFRLPQWVTYGKLRASWAQVGNDAESFVINPGFDQEKYLQTDGSYIYGQYVPRKLYGDGGYLKPERKNAWEIGAEWMFLKNRIGLDIALYKENTRDQIMNISLPEESGATTQLVNAGNVQNKGIEIALHTVPLRQRDWQWDIDLTYARNQNKILSLHPNLQDYVLLGGALGSNDWRVASVAMAGADYGLLVSDIMPARNENGSILLSWRDEYRAAYPKRSSEVGVIGSMMPRFTGSIATGLRYKNVSFRVLLDIRVGGYIASYSNRYGLSYGLSENSLQYRDAASGGITWTSTYADSYGQTFHDGVIPEGIFAQATTVTTPSGAKVDVSGLSFREAYEKGYVEPVHASDYHYLRNSWSAGTVNEDWVHEVNYIALREVTLAYRLPAKAASRVNAQSIRVSLTARNLGYLYNSLPNNLHPESLIGTTTSEFRERGFVPYTASFMANITLDF